MKSQTNLYKNDPLLKRNYEHESFVTSQYQIPNALDFLTVSSLAHLFHVLVLGSFDILIIVKRTVDSAKICGTSILT